MSAPALTLRRWRRAEYERLVELGVFDDDPVELIGGHLIVAEPQGSYHSTSIGKVDDALRAALPPGWTLRAQMPLALDDESAPEPDVAVVAGSRDDYTDSHPQHPVLVVEVAESSLGLDREHKGSLYARAGVPDYWIVNLMDRVLEEYRDPEPDGSAPYGWRYGSVERLSAAAVAVPIALPSVRIVVADMLPRPPAA
jgi:Uma2 family endonuclease